MKKDKKKALKILLGSVAGFAVLGSICLLNDDTASAHGYISSPKSRVYEGVLEKGQNYDAALEKYGKAITNPAGIEWFKGFPEAGPSDGHIASGEGLLNGAIGDYKLDTQQANYWKMQDLNGGPNKFTWTYTAPHETTKWEYFITKKGWDPNAPLTRSEFEKIATIDQPGHATADTYPTHTVNLPTDRSGYYVVLAVWTVDNTDKSFYQVVDVNLHNDGNGSGDEDTVKPDKVTGIKAENITTNSADISWNESKDNKGVTEYQIYRDGKLVNRTADTKFHDTNLTANTTYHYTVTAKDASDNVSDVSDDYTMTTAKAPENDTTPPTPPTHLHAMGATSSSISLMWTASTDNVGVEKYIIYRNGVPVAETKEASFNDTNLEADTYYVYYILAVDKSGNRSTSTSNIFIEKTANADNPLFPEWDATKVYKGGDVVSYKGKHYRAKWEQNGLIPGADQWGPWELLND
ncbi:lytic polysaccharide monooxygenase [Listeria sp. PSOL-1]|uniref:lytic polysaccharide monooxygenase n=1 Tax=Listeria sp. PSOL-1 TaxID=1844999 RepID=UPI0013CF8D90|nr:lytic polysaccharide monooxygenase [Listeria sp. PSOL-1]